MRLATGSPLVAIKSRAVELANKVKILPVYYKLLLLFYCYEHCHHRCYCFLLERNILFKYKFCLYYI
jgi:hypothetical protein